MEKKISNGKRVLRKAFLAVFAIGLLSLMSFTKTISVGQMTAALYIPGALAYYEAFAQMPQDDQVYKDVKNPPVYPGGIEAMQSFIIKNIKYPEDCKKSGKEGTVYVGFIIDKSGKVKDVKAMKPVHPSLDAEAVRIVKSMPAWKAGTNDAGKPVKVEYTLPIKFALK